MIWMRTNNHEMGQWIKIWLMIYCVQYWELRKHGELVNKWQAKSNKHKKNESAQLFRKYGIATAAAVAVAADK